MTSTVTRRDCERFEAMMRAMTARCTALPSQSQSPVIAPAPQQSNEQQVVALPGDAFAGITLPPRPGHH